MKDPLPEVSVTSSYDECFGQPCTRYSITFPPNMAYDPDLFSAQGVVDWLDAKFPDGYVVKWDIKPEKAPEPVPFGTRQVVITELPLNDSRRAPQG